MKIHVFVILGLAALPSALATFGITITNAAGATLVATTAAQTTAIAAGALLAAGAGAALGFLLSQLTQGGDDDGTGTGYGGYSAPSTGYGTPSSGYGAPSGGYGAPSTGYGRPKRRRSQRGKRQAGNDTLPSGAKEAVKIIVEVLDTVSKSDPADCYRRLICDISTGEQQFTTNTMLILFENEATMSFLPAQYQNPYYELNLASKVGKQVKSIEVCENLFKCPLSGHEIDSVAFEMDKKTPDSKKVLGSGADVLNNIYPKNVVLSSY